ncbi:hypothetical protein PHMEG_00028899 [Phytophthora megakarya]|uniref:Peptidase A2 domain-containing protein n=1 Tax=Phytophthora megakarya TaxID=4795 RepID=A0A225V3V6_9STRA|nr:hypothetical protein PHMEG_00028899 [Phytophthora megakarya]
MRSGARSEVPDEGGIGIDESSSDDDRGLYRRPQQDGVLHEYIRQIEKASSPEGERSSQKIELATHRPLGQIRPFSGLRNKSENSMQWLRGFVYEMKGTRASPDEWCMPFQPSSKDGALHWHRQLPKKTKRTWSLLSSSFIRNARIQFDKGGRKAREAIPGNLWRSWTRTKLCHVKVYDIHELEEMIIEILMVDDHESAKGSSQPRSRSHDTSRSKRSDHPRDGYSRGDRRDRDFGRRRDDSRNIPRVTFTEGSKALETQRTYTSDEDDRHDIYDDYNDYDNHDGWNADKSRYTDEEREEYEDSADGDGFVAAANAVERRNEADGTSTENGLEVNNTFGGESIMGSPEDSLGVKTEGIVSSVVQETPRRRLNKEVRLLPGERMGWWSVQKFDRRVRMRTLVEGAVNDQRTRIFLDTGANISIVLARYAKKLSLRDIPNQDCSMDIQGISKEKATMTRKTTVKIMLGWERVYVFDMWGLMFY